MSTCSSHVRPKALFAARFPASPPQLAEKGVTVRVIFTAIDSEGFQSVDTDASAQLLEAATARIVSDARLYEAHEQLVLDGKTCWIGDCMRREPAKRDAYENYSNSDELTARAATVAFARLWQVGTPSAPISRTSALFGFKSSAQAEVIARNATGEENQPPPTALTRH